VKEKNLLVSLCDDPLLVETLGFNRYIVYGVRVSSGDVLVVLIAGNFSGKHAKTQLVLVVG